MDYSYMKITAAAAAASLLLLSPRTAAAHPASSVQKFRLAEDELQQPDTVPAEDYDTLEEVVVSVQKPLVQSNGEKISYNVSEDAASKSSSVLEMLRKVPGVTVDGQDNIRVNGQSNFRIYVNGKEDPMLSSDPGKILKAMPASTILKIEVINEPGAKYDAEGTAGILNFITNRQQRTEGVAGSLSAGISSEAVQGGVSVRAKYGKFTVAAHAEAADSHIHPQDNQSHSTVVYPSNSTDHKMLTNNKQSFPWSYYGGGVDLSWEPNARNLFTVNFSISDMFANLSKFENTNRMYDSSDNLRWSFSTLGNGRVKEFSISAGASYQHSFNDKGHNIVASYLYSRGAKNLYLLQDYKETFNYPTEQYQSLNSDGKNNEHTVQLDYSLPLEGDKHLVEAGLKGVIRRNYATGYNASGEDKYGLNKYSITDMEQLQDIGAAYASYSGNYGKVGVKAGLRYEHTRMGIRFHHETGEDFTSRLNDIVPNAAISYSFSPANSLRLAYQMRITRPSLSKVNPQEQKFSDMQIMSGNPNLSSERNNIISLTYSNFTTTFGGNVSLEYSLTDNCISQFIFADGNVIRQTYANLGRKNIGALSGFFNYNITNGMRFTINGRLQYIDLNSPNPLSEASAGSPSRLKASGWSGNFGASFDYTMPLAIKLNVYGGKDWGNISLTEKGNGWYYYGLSLSRSFLKEDALTLSLNANGFCQKDRKFISRSLNTDMQSYSVWQSRSWNVGFSISWNFGSLKSDVKKTGKRIINDDQSTSTSSKGML